MGCRVSREAREVCKHVFVVSTKKNREMDEEGKRSLASTFEENKKKIGSIIAMSSRNIWKLVIVNNYSRQ